MGGAGPTPKADDVHFEGGVEVGAATMEVFHELA